MARRERDILEVAIRRVAEQAANTNKVIDEAMEAGLADDHPVTIAAKQVRLELLKVKADLGTGTRQAGLQLPEVRSGGPLGPGRQHVRPLDTGGIDSPRSREPVI